MGVPSFNSDNICSLFYLNHAVGRGTFLTWEKYLIALSEASVFLQPGDRCLGT